MSNDIIQKPKLIVKKTDNKIVYKTIEEPRLLTGIDKLDFEYDLVTVLATSDFQVNPKRFFSNTGWNYKSLNSRLVYPNISVDVNHNGGNTFTGYVIAVEYHITSNFKRKQKGWKYERPMGYNIMTLALPKGSLCQTKAKNLFNNYGIIPVSIEFVYKSKRSIVAITICDMPHNQEAFAICARMDSRYYNNIYPNKDHPIFNRYKGWSYPLGELPKEIYECAIRQYSDVIANKKENSLTRVVRDVSPVIFIESANPKGMSGYNLFYKTNWSKIPKGSRSNKSAMLGQIWKCLSEQEQIGWREKAKDINSKPNRFNC